MKLQVTICSFSYKKDIPEDTSEHGGGFVFDCRSLPNPGRFPEMTDKTGNDLEVIKFLEQHKQVSIFLNYTFALVGNTVENYIQRDFTHLMVCYGCTGGQHRSVYSANMLANYLADKYDVDVNIIHREINV